MRKCSEAQSVQLLRQLRNFLIKHIVEHAVCGSNDNIARLDRNGGHKRLLGQVVQRVGMRAVRLGGRQL